MSERRLEWQSLDCHAYHSRSTERLWNPDKEEVVVRNQSLLFVGVAVALAGIASGCSSPALATSTDSGVTEAGNTDTGTKTDAHQSSSQGGSSSHSKTADAGHDAHASTHDAREEDASHHDAKAHDAEVRDAAPLDGAGDATTCDGTKAPSQSSCVIAEKYGVFVAGPVIGNDITGSGTRAHPYATMGKAIPTAKAAGKRVYACATTYPESVAVGTAADGIAVYGGLACPSTGGDAATDASAPAWSYTGKLAVIAPTAVGYALDVESLTTGATFVDIGAVAMPEVAAGTSSIAVMVNASTGTVSFTRLSATAGAGAAGASPAAPASNFCSAATQIGQPPVPGAGAAGAAGGTCQCAITTDVSNGGSGGAGELGTTGQPGTPAMSGSGAGGTDGPGQGGATARAPPQAQQARPVRSARADGWLRPPETAARGGSLRVAVAAAARLVGSSPPPVAAVGRAVAAEAAARARAVAAGASQWPWSPAT